MTRLRTILMAVLFAALGVLLQVGIAPAETTEELGARVTALQNEIHDLRADLKAFRDNLRQAAIDPKGANIQTPTSGGQAVPYPLVACKAGQYAAGIAAWGSPDTTRYCIGCLTGVALLCLPFQ
jgi:hypothetical protein